MSIHAAQKAVNRDITIKEIRETAADLKIIEDYPLDKYSPSCLLLGFTLQKRPLHIQVTTDSSSILKVITLYQPNNDKWSNDYKIRRKYEIQMS